jgi:hypothetical protein
MVCAGKTFNFVVYLSTYGTMYILKFETNVIVFFFSDEGCYPFIERHTAENMKNLPSDNHPKKRDEFATQSQQQTRVDYSLYSRFEVDTGQCSLHSAMVLRY